MKINRSSLTFLLVLLVGTACTAVPYISRDSNDSSSVDPANLPDLGPAPELTNEIWLNTDRPLRLEYLRGKVVLIDMWTYG